MQLLVHSAAELVPQSNLGVQFLSAESHINTTGVPLHPAAADAGPGFQAFHIQLYGLAVRNVASLRLS